MIKKLLFIGAFFAFICQDLQAQYPLVRIDSIQRVAAQLLAVDSTISPLQGDTVRIQGVVVFDPDNSVLSTSRKFSYIQDTSSSIPFWKGINIHCLNTDTAAVRLFDNFDRGNVVEVTGVVGGFPANLGSDETQLNLLRIASKVVGFAPLPTPVVTQLSEFAKFNGTPNMDWQPTTGEKYEGMFVEFRNVIVTDVSTFGGGRVSWNIKDAAGNRIPTRDGSSILRPPFISSTASTPPNPAAPIFIQQGKVFSYIRGVITEVNGTWVGTTNNFSYTLHPLDSTDIGPVAASPPVVTTIVNMPSVPNSSDSVAIGAFVTDIDGTVSSVTLNYAIGLSSTNFMTQPMTLDSLDHYSTKIGPQADGTFVKFFITAEDNTANVTAAPDSLATNSFYKVIDGGITSISQLQESVDGGGTSIYSGKSLDGNVMVGARIISTSSVFDLGTISIQDSDQPFSGIIAQSGPNNDFDNWGRGDSVLITACTVIENFGVTTLTNVTATRVATSAYVPPVVKLPFDSVLALSYDYTEAYEAMLIEFNNVFVVDTNADSPANFGEFLINPDSLETNGFRVDDLSNDLFSNGTTGLFNTDSLLPGQKLDYIRGLMFFSFGNWKMLPRNRADIDGFNTLTSVEPAALQDLRISKLYPNPSSDYIFVEFNTAKPDLSKATIYDLNGKLIETFNRQLDAGEHRLVLNVASYQTGTYIVEITSNGRQRVERFVIAR